MLLEPRLWACLLRWLTGRHDGHRPGAYGYHDCVRITIWVALGLTMLEGGLVDLVLALAVPGTVWPWVAAGVHVYALALLRGFYASLVTRPHVIEARHTAAARSVLTELVVSRAAIRRARVAVRPDRGRTRWASTPMPTPAPSPTATRTQSSTSTPTSRCWSTADPAPRRRTR